MWGTKMINHKWFGISAAIFLLLAAAATVGSGSGLADNEAAPTVTARLDLERFCKALWIHEGVRHKNLVVFPVSLREAGDTTAYISLDEALENGLVKITEVGSGSVPTLRLNMLSAEPMFFMAGEVLTGAKQDRILTHDLLFRGMKGSIDLPVYCVEQGRWTRTSEDFKAGKILGSTALRKTAVMKEGQHNAWAEVQEKNTRMSAETTTDTFQATYQSEKYQKAEAEFMDKLRNIPALHGGTVVGVAIAIDGKVVSADIFANNALFTKLWPKVLKAAITDAVTTGDSVLEDSAKAREFIGAALEAEIKRQDNPSQGEEFTIRSEAIQGSFIKTESGVAHLALFTGALKRKTPEMQEPNPERQIQQQHQNFDNSLRLQENGSYMNSDRK